MMKKQPMQHALPELRRNLMDVARVFEWADLMGYRDPKKFSERFLRHYGVRPQKIMELVRLESIVRQLRNEEQLPNLVIARRHSLPCEKTLNNFTNYHTGHSPTQLKTMEDGEVRLLFDRLWSRISIENRAGKRWNGTSKTPS